MISISLLAIVCTFLFFVNAKEEASIVLRGNTRQLNRQKAVEFTLINSITNEAIISLENGQMIDLGDYGLTFPNINIQAKPTNTTNVKSVKFGLDDNANFRTEVTEPYALCGYSGGNYLKCNELKLCSHTVTATVYSGTGSVLANAAVSFELVQSSSPVPVPVPVTFRVKVPVRVPDPVKVPVTVPVPVFVDQSVIVGLELINSDTNFGVKTLVYGETIALNDYGLTIKNINIQAVTSGKAIGSMKLGLDGRASFRTVNTAPYALCGYNGGDYSACTGLTLGSHAVTVTVYSEIGGTGIVLETLSSNFTLVEYSSPATVPVHYPVSVPVPAPAPISVPAPAVSPSPIPTINECSVLPKFIGEWETYSPYPLIVGESQGALLSSQFLQFSGFHHSYSLVTRKVFALDLTNPRGTWIEQDEVPHPSGITHAALAEDSAGKKVYLCGGYLGPHPGPATDICYTFSYGLASGKQWSPLPALPGKRAGGALFLNKASNTLTFMAGADRPNPSDPSYTVDFNDTWQLSLSNPSTGWTSKTDVPYFANHVGHTTMKCNNSVERHFILGGQLGENEGYTNQKNVYEYVPVNNTWIKHTDMPFGRGHISESTIPYKGCGIIVVSGAINNIMPDERYYSRTSDISYYNLADKKWTSIGNYVQPQATPVCKIYSGYLYCQTGPIDGALSVRRKIV